MVLLSSYSYYTDKKSEADVIVTTIEQTKVESRKKKDASVRDVVQTTSLCMICNDIAGNQVLIIVIVIIDL